MQTGCSMKPYGSMTCWQALLLAVVLAMAGCQKIPKDALKLSPESLEKRSLQTRKYQGVTEEEILSASASVIQYLGFNIDESESRLGLIVGSKDRDATDYGQWATSAAVAFFSIGMMSVDVDKSQKLRVSLVIRPVPDGDGKGHFVRVTFQRIIWDAYGKVTLTERLEEPSMYQEFFDRLSKAVFLEGQNI